MSVHALHSESVCWILRSWTSRWSVSPSVWVLGTEHGYLMMVYALNCQAISLATSLILRHLFSLLWGSLSRLDCLWPVYSSPTYPCLPISGLFSYLVFENQNAIHTLEWLLTQYVCQLPLSLCFLPHRTVAFLVDGFECLVWKTVPQKSVSFHVQLKLKLWDWSLYKGVAISL